MKGQDNLPPGVTNRQIEEQAGAYEPEDESPELFKLKCCHCETGTYLTWEITFMSEEKLEICSRCLKCQARERRTYLIHSRVTGDDIPVSIANPLIEQEPI